MRDRRKRKTTGFFLFLLILVLQIAGCGNVRGNEWSGAESAASRDTHQQLEKELTGKEQQKAASFSENEENLEVHFIDVGQGDATLIRQGEHAMLIDGGDNDQGTAIQSYLQYQGIKHLDYVIGTHPDSDHVGGLDVVMYKFSWDQVILPELEKDTKTYQDVLKVIDDKKKKITVPIVGDLYRLGDAQFTIIAPVEEDYGDDWNNYSVGILLQFGENRFLFTGDAEEEAEQDMLEEGMDLSADVLKASHHGSDTANTMTFLEKVNPASVVISCGEGNSYGHPRAGAMNRFRSIGAKVYRTDEQGTVVAVSDGNEITWNCSPSESWKAGEPQGGQRTDSGQNGENFHTDEKLEETEETEAEYVINENTGKFHRMSCSSVEQMKEENRKYSSQSRQELITQGYEPCGRCNP